MLTDVEREEIERELTHYPERRAGCIEALRIVQRHRSWISNDTLKDIAEFLRMTTHELDAVATFYNLIFRKPVGRHVLFLCNSISCWIAGYDNLRRDIESRLGVKLGETTADGRLTVLPIVCLGCCDRAPAVMIDDEVCQASTETLLDILQRYQ
ncbi:MAG TPA: NADH-quinone oxidoreductase subunit NuoE [Nitrospira sp.]|nr:NADH-quinone oxidoreductase subunit NuoE [Nitrospira sp.]